MLESLHISNYALIDTVDIDFRPGLNIITGETGAGKSIILGALSLLLGGRADTKAVRHAENKSVIEAIFNLADYPALRRFFNENDIDWDEARCILRREISPNGRSRAFINDTPVPVSKLQELAIQLVDIHSQHQNQLLARPDYQMRVIDTLAGNEQLLADYALKYQVFRNSLRNLKAQRKLLEKNRSDEEFIRYQLEGLTRLNLEPGELEQLEQQQEIMSNAAEIKSHIFDALQALTDGQFNVASLADDAAEACRRLGNLLPDSDDIRAQLEGIGSQASEIARYIAALDSRFDADPRQLDGIQERINEIYSAMQRHKADSVDQLIATRDKLSRTLDNLENADDRIAAIEKDTRRALALAREAAAEISRRRSEAAERFAEELRQRAVPLGMKNLQVQILVKPTEISPTGTDSVEFTFAFNKNQTPMPVSGAASGGEISRLMLCIKAIIADKMSLPSIIFDEVDTGVSGDVANRIGEMMAQIGNSLQVIAITHLPQVAAKGNSHFKVYKEDDENATHTRIEPLDDDRRVDELALMLSGNSDDPAARANAKSLLSRK